LGNDLGNEAMTVVRRTHFKQARDLIALTGGREIKTIGDSLMVVFRTPLSALDFAIMLSKDTAHERVKIRAGIHVGLVQIEEEDVFGTMVNFTARVQSQTKGAEIWISDRAKSDIEEEKAKAHRSVRWMKHRDCELKGFQESMCFGLSLFLKRQPRQGELDQRRG
jgi:class 3 adenylate cyclase